MKNSTKLIIDNLIEENIELVDIKQSIMESLEILINCYNSEHKVLVCGNGGSASDSLHIVGELVKSFKIKRTLRKDIIDKIYLTYPEEAESMINNLEGSFEAHSLVNETALITAFSNDKNAVFSFAQQVYSYGKKKDVLIAISTSGNSENVVLAAKIAKLLDMTVISLTGENKCKLDFLSDIAIKAPSRETYRIQEYHLPIYHALCASLENEYYGE